MFSFHSFLLLWLILRVSDGLTCYECRDPKKQLGNCPGVSTVRLEGAGHRCRILSSGNITVSQGIVEERLCAPESLKISLVNLRQIYKYYGGDMRASCCDFDLCNTFESTIKNVLLGERRKSWKENYQILGSKYKKKRVSPTTPEPFNQFSTTETLSLVSLVPQATSLPPKSENDFEILENDIEDSSSEDSTFYYYGNNNDDYKEETNGFFNSINPQDPNEILRASLRESNENGARRSGGLSIIFASSILLGLSI